MNLKIPMVDLKTQFREIEAEIRERLDEIFRSTQFILGPNVDALEKEVASYHGVSFGVGLASGTDALHLSLRAIGIGPGDEVITTPFTFIATAEAISYTGAKPVFVDIDPLTFNIDPSKIEKGITSKTKAILVVHLFGLSANMDKILTVAKGYNLKVIEDCAQAFGAEYKEKKIGTFGEVGCFSFFPSKNLGCYGDGGMVITNNRDINERIRLLRNHGSKKRYYHSEIGFNSRLDEIQATVLRVKLNRIDEYNKKRREKAGLYSERLKGIPIQTPCEPQDCYHVYHQYTIRIPSVHSNLRDRVSESLASRSIASTIYYPLPLHLQEVYRFLCYRNGDLPVSEVASEEVLSLPIYPEITEEEIDLVCDTIKETFNK